MGTTRQTFILMDIFHEAEYRMINGFNGCCFVKVCSIVGGVKAERKSDICLREGGVLTLHTRAREVNANNIGLLLDNVHAREHIDTVNQQLLAQDDYSQNA